MASNPKYIRLQSAYTNFLDTMYTLFKSRGWDTKRIAGEIGGCHENALEELQNEPPHDIAGPEPPDPYGPMTLSQ